MLKKAIFMVVKKVETNIQYIPTMKYNLARKRNRVSEYMQ